MRDKRKCIRYTTSVYVKSWEKSMIDTLSPRFTLKFLKKACWHPNFSGEYESAASKRKTFPKALETRSVGC